MPPRAPNPVPLSGPPAGLTGVSLSRWVVQVCTGAAGPNGLAFTAAGVCALEPPPAQETAVLEAWIGAGKHGGMSYMSSQLPERLSPELLLPGARSVVMVADRYAERDGGFDRLAETERADGVARGRIARYARGRDYHEQIKRRVHRLADALRVAFPGAEFRSFADTAPVLERHFAQRCGLGWLAKNAMLIHPLHGSYLLLGGLFTTLDLPAPPPSEQPGYTDHCGTCTRCIDACPTKAIAVQPLNGGTDATPRVDGSRCVSYLTIEHQGPIERSLTPGVGEWVFGCDICQEVCPHNSPRPSLPGTPVRPEYAAARATLPLLEVLNWQAEDRSRLTVSAMKRATAEMFRRNAVIALANGYSARPDPSVLAALRQAARDESALVSTAAADALDRLGQAVR